MRRPERIHHIEIILFRPQTLLSATRPGCPATAITALLRGFLNRALGLPAFERRGLSDSAGAEAISQELDGVRDAAVSGRFAHVQFLRNGIHRELLEIAQL